MFSKTAKELKSKGDQAYAAGKWKKALEFYEKASLENSADARLEQKIGDLHRRLKDNDQAIARYKNVARIYAKDGFWAKAIAISKLVLEMDPSDQEVQRELSVMYAKQSSDRETTVPEALAPKSYHDSKNALSISGAEPLSPNLVYQDQFLGNTVDLQTTNDNKSEPGESISDDSGEYNYDGHQIDLASIDEEIMDLGDPISDQKAIPLFSELNPVELAAVLERLSVRRYPPNVEVCKEGSEGHSMYMIAEGAVEVYTSKSDNQIIQLSQLRGGAFFGEYGLLTSGRRNASVRTITETELLEITRNDFDVISSKHPRIWIVLEEHLKKRMIQTIFAKSPVFGALNAQEREELSDYVSMRNLSKGEVLMEVETEGDEMYFIRSGSFSVTLSQGREKLLVGQVGPGEYVGEVAMLTGKPRNATVTALEDAGVFVLRRTDAAKVLKRNPAVLRALKDKMVIRAKEAQDAFASLKEAMATLDFV